MGKTREEMEGGGVRVRGVIGGWSQRGDAFI